MSDIHQAPESAAVAPAPESDHLSVQDAAAQMGKWREEQSKPDQSAAPEPAAAEPELPIEADSAAPQEPPAGEADAPEPEELPPIEPPRSWTKEDKEEFASYPREAQEKIARREQDREAAFRRSQNEAAEARKAFEEDRAKADQVRQQYEQALPTLLQTLEQQQQGEFSDIKTMADIETLAREDWPRYALWDAQQKKIAAIRQEVEQAKQRQEQESSQKWEKFAEEQDRLAAESIPDLADKDKAAKIAENTLSMLEGVGFKKDEIVGAWNGQPTVNIRDYRMQQVLLKAALYDQAKATATKSSAKPVPPVQRPGVAPAKGAAVMAQIDKTKERLQSSKGNAAIDAAAELLALQRQVTHR